MRYLVSQHRQFSPWLASEEVVRRLCWLQGWGDIQSGDEEQQDPIQFSLGATSPREVGVRKRSAPAFCMPYKEEG